MKKFHFNISVFAGSLCNVLLLGLATIKTYVYVCDVHHWHLPWAVDSWTLPLYGFWLWIVSAGIIALTKKGLSSSARWSCLCAPFVASDCCNPFLAVALSMQYHCSTGSQDFHRRSCHWSNVTLSRSKLLCLQNIVWAEKQRSIIVQCYNLACTWDLAMWFAHKYTWWGILFHKQCQLLSCMLMKVVCA